MVACSPFPRRLNVNDLVPGARGRDTLNGLSKSMALGAIDKVVEEEKWKKLSWSVSSHNYLSYPGDVWGRNVRCRRLHSAREYKDEALCNMRVRLSYAPDWLTSAMREAFGAYRIVYRIGQKPVRGLALPISPVLQWFTELWPEGDDQMDRIRKYFALCSETYCKYHMDVGQRFEWSREDHPLPVGTWEVVVSDDLEVREVAGGEMVGDKEGFYLPSYRDHHKFLKLI